MKKINKWFGLNTIRKKVLLLSKLAGGAIVLFYVLTSELPTSRNIAFLIWFILLVVNILGVDMMLGRFISKPLNEINRTAEQMANLDFSAHCNVHTNDEFGALSQNLNTMFANLGESLDKLEVANKHFVDGRYHRQGVGRKLFETVLENASNELTVNSSPYAKEIYHHLGFEDTNTEQIVTGIRFIPMIYRK